MSQELPKPQPADVIFVYSKGKDAFLNVALQKWIFDKERDHGPWFSHVALALNDRLGLEASTAPSDADEPTWSGVELKEGVRLILLPDLLIPSRDWRVLRNAKASELAKDALEIKQPYISGVYESEYSIEAFQEYAANSASLIAGVSDIFGFGDDWTSAPNDVAAKVGQDFRNRVLRDFPDHEFSFESRNFYCSKLVIAILGVVGLLPDRDVDARVTPSALFDELKGMGWDDVTDGSYPEDQVQGWDATSKVPWQTDYFDGVGQAQFWSNHEAFDELWRIVEKQFAHADRRIQAYLDLLDDLRNGPQKADPRLRAERWSSKKPFR
jgi:hypothetical protein